MHHPGAFAAVPPPAVTLPALTEAKLLLYDEFRTKHRLRCHPPQIDRLLDLRHASRLDRLQAAFRVLGKELSIQILDAA